MVEPSLNVPCQTLNTTRLQCSRFVMGIIKTFVHGEKTNKRPELSDLVTISRKFF